LLEIPVVALWLQSGGGILGAETDFKCTGGYSEGIPSELLNKTEYSLPQAYSERMALARLSQEMKNIKNDRVCRLPFCLTVEAEAMGADFNLDDMKNGPRVREYALSQVEELEKIDEIDFSHGRIKAVLEAVEFLNGQNETVALHIAGPFTIVSSLIEPKTLYKAIRKKNESVVRGLQRIEENLVEYALQSFAKGVKILSYSDPAGAMDIIGPQMYQHHSGRVTSSILQKLTSKPHHAVIHLCGKTSTALEKTGFCQSCRLDHAENQTYLEVLADLIDDKECTRIIGHSCFRQVPWKTRNPKIQEIRIDLR
jgi:uroporphyrinogen-III decarboxylase